MFVLMIEIGHDSCPENPAESQPEHAYYAKEREFPKNHHLDKHKYN